MLLGNRRSVVMLTIDPEVLLATARQGLTRSFTDEECLTYRIDPCPTLGGMGG